MYKTLQIMGKVPYQPVQDFSHQQYVAYLKPFFVLGGIGEWSAHPGPVDF